MRNIVVFDFDGTLTKKDTLLEFIKYCKGKKAFIIGFLLYSPLLIAYKLKLYPNWKIKQKIFSYFFKGMSLDKFNNLCNNFFKERHSNLLYESAVKKIDEYISTNTEVIIISASIENWVIPFGKYLKVNEVLGTKLETDKNGIITGKFLSKNCYGKEKVRRLRKIISDRESYNIIAFGDSKGDKELLEFANIGHYKYFK